MDWGGGITYLAETRLKGKTVRFGIKDADRLSTVCLVGRAGSGRAHFLANMALQDIARGAGILVLDGGGNLTQTLLERLPESARERLIVLDPSDGEHPFSWNPLDDFHSLSSETAPALLSETLASIYQIQNGPVLAFAASAMLSRKGATLLFLYEAVTDAKARDRFFPAKSPAREEFESLLAASPDSSSAITENGRYLAKDALMRNLIGQRASKFTLGALKEGLPAAQGSMAQAGSIVVVDFSRIRMFPTRATPLVRLFLSVARAHASKQAPVPLYVHDCLRYLSQEDLDRALLDRGIALTVSDTAHGEEDGAMRTTLLHRAGSVAAFAPHEADMPFVERVFYPYVAPEELEKLEEGQMSVVLAIDSVRSRPFFANALPPAERTGVSYQDLSLASRNTYTTSRLAVDKLFRPKSEDDKDGEK